MAIDVSKSGIKGLTDAGLAKLPRVFVHDHLNLQIKSGPPPADVKIPVIDFAGVNIYSTRRADSVAKEKLYSREESKKVTFNTKFDMSRALAAYWRDILTCVMALNPPAPEEITEACGDMLLH
ncbi:hypothetical protein F3Y22_tig00002799pilonHSYRG00114 [Hibiscus syriacus]|uniref:Uncharacterized protein n=1 Tax=Hibiscus syriacus TaxID=106335 RepID=A0A6A3CQ28_HIBSY|nr:hypothetical protein F3Y22_tig00002799pilonHSYRG00114 [Hibiscus syriacus]